MSEKHSPGSGGKPEAGRDSSTRAAWRFPKQKIRFDQAAKRRGTAAQRKAVEAFFAPDGQKIGGRR